MVLSEYQKLEPGHLKTKAGQRRLCFKYICKDLMEV
jgi:hypothetical protein